MPAHSGGPAPPRPAPPLQPRYLGSSTSPCPESAPTGPGVWEQWGQEAPASAMQGRVGPERPASTGLGFLSDQVAADVRDTVSVGPGPYALLGSCEAYMLLWAWALNGEELSLNGDLPSHGSAGLCCRGVLYHLSHQGGSNFSIYRSSLKHFVCRSSETEATNGGFFTS